jgi:hypothetical protein
MAVPPRRRRKSGISGEIQDFAKSFEAGWKMADRVKNPEGRGRRVSDAEERRRETERERERYQTDAENAARGRAGGGGDAVGASSTEVSNRFMGVVQSEKNGLTNPYGLAAVAAFGQRESNWSPSRVNATWNDRDESGRDGTSGGTLSWREDRLRNLERYASGLGEKGRGSPETQARFFLQEDPRLIARLQNAKSSEEANEIMGAAWRYAGWNRNSPERAARLSATRSWTDRFKAPKKTAPDPAAAEDKSTKPAASPADGEQKATDTAIPEEGYGDETQDTQGYGQDQDQDQEYDQGYEDEFDTGGYGDASDMEFSQGGVVPAPTWSQGAADARGSRFSSYSGGMPARQPRVRTAPTTTAAAPPRVPASQRLQAMRDARAARGSEYERMVASNKAANEKRLADIQAEKDAKAAREAVANEAARVQTWQPQYDPSANSNFGGSGGGGGNYFYEGGYVDRVDPDDEEYQERARANYEGRGEDEELYLQREDPDDIRGRLQEEEYRRGLRSGGYREEGGYDEAPRYREPPNFAGESPSTREDKGTPSRPRARFAGESPSTRDDRGRAAIPEKPAPKKEGPARKPEARPASSTRSSSAAPAARPAARQQQVDTGGENSGGSAIGFIEDQFRQRDALVGRSPAASIVAEGAAGGVADAVSAGLKWIQSSFGLDSGAISPGPNDPQRQQALRAFASNEGAASADDIRTIDNTIDPDKKLKPHELALARLYGTYKFYVDRGEDAKASKVAGAMLMHIREKVQLYGSVVSDRLQRGDRKGAAEAAQVAYDQLPNGKRADIRPDGNQFSYSLFDADGEVTEQGKMTINQMMRVATGMQDGTTWFKEMGKLASPRDKEERLRREGEARRAPRNADGSPMTGRTRTAAAPPVEGRTPGERREFAERQRLAREQEGRERRINTQAEVQMGQSLTPGVSFPDDDSRTAAATGIGRQRDALVSADRGVEMADREFKRATVKPNKDTADPDEIELAAGKAFASDDGKATPFGAVEGSVLAPLKGIIVRGASRAIAATPGLTSSEAGRTISNMLKSGMDLRPDGTVAPKNEPRGAGIRLDRQTIEDITRFRRGAAAPAQPRPGSGPAMPPPVRPRDPAAAEIGAGFLQQRGIQPPPRTQTAPPRDPNVFSDLGM